MSRMDQRAEWEAEQQKRRAREDARSRFREIIAQCSNELTALDRSLGVLIGTSERVTEDCECVWTLIVDKTVLQRPGDKKAEQDLLLLYVTSIDAIKDTCVEEAERKRLLPFSLIIEDPAGSRLRGWIVDKDGKYSKLA